MTPTKQKSRPQVGDLCWKVEWCSKLAFNECGDVDRDSCTMARKILPTQQEAEAFAVKTFPVTTQTFGVVEITPLEFTMEDADLYPRGHWQYCGDTYYFEGESNDDGTPFFNH